jgi:hypothetical protein
MKALLATVIFLFTIPFGLNAQHINQVCTTNRNAPPTSIYYWRPDTTVKVYFTRDMFSPEQRLTLFEVMTVWTEAAKRVGADIRFVDAGDSHGLVHCNDCLTVTRSEVYKRDRKHYAFFSPLSWDRDGLLISAWIDFDVSTTSLKALRSFMAHEMGHGMGLWDCKTCKKNQTIMNGFPGINRDNGLASPSDCDLEVVRRVYQHQRQLAIRAPGKPLLSAE